MTVLGSPNNPCNAPRLPDPESMKLSSLAFGKMKGKKTLELQAVSRTADQWQPRCENSTSPAQSANDPSFLAHTFKPPGLIQGPQKHCQSPPRRSCTTPNQQRWLRQPLDLGPDSQHLQNYRNSNLQSMRLTTPMVIWSPFFEATQLTQFS